MARLRLHFRYFAEIQIRVGWWSGCPIDSPENHPARRGLQRTGHVYDHVLTDRAAALFDHDHRTIFQVTNALAHLVAGFDDPHI